MIDNRVSGPLRKLIIFTCVISVLSALLNSLFVNYFQVLGPQDLLSLSWYGMEHYFWWQPLTYLFVLEGTSIHVFFLLNLFFYMYILWVLGETLQERIGRAHFFTLYFISGIFAGLTAFAMMSLTGHHQTFFGPSCALLAVFVVWAMCNPNGLILLFFLLPIKIKWLLFGILGAIGIISLSQADFVSLTFYLSAALFGYFYGLLILGLEGPTEHTRAFEDFVRRMQDSIKKLFHFKKKLNGKEHKIYDFSSGEPILDDEAFIDAMLTKISKHGERSLTANERRRMDQLSQKKQDQ